MIGVVSLPQTWLLAGGWRSHGVIDLHEVHRVAPVIRRKRRHVGRAEVLCTDLMTVRTRTSPRPGSKLARLWASIALPEGVTLRRGATERRLDKAEKRLGNQLPADLRASLLIHDGEEP